MAQPFEHFTFRELRIVAGDIDASAVTSTDVHLRYSDPDSFTVEDVVTIQPGGEQQKFKLRLTNRERQEVTFFFEHHLVDGTTQRSLPESTTFSSIVVNDPFPAALELDFVPVFAPGSVRTVFADVLYEDPAHGYRRAASLTFDGADPQRQQLRIALFDPARRTYRLTFTILSSDGGVRRIETETDVERQLVGETF